MEPAIMTARGTNRLQLPVRSHFIVANPAGFRLRMFLRVNQFDVLITPGLERVHIVGQTTILQATNGMKRTEALLGAARYIGILFLADVALLASDPGFFIPDVLLHESENSLLIVPILDQIRGQKLQEQNSY